MEKEILTEKDNFMKKYIDRCKLHTIEQQVITDKAKEINEKYNVMNFDTKINRIRKDHEKNTRKMNNNVKKAKGKQKNHAKHDNIKFNYTNNENCNSHDNIGQYQEIINKLKIKYKEYIFCQYENGMTQDNFDKCANDNLIKMYDTIIYNIMNNKFDNIYEVCNELTKEIDIVIETKILLIKKKHRHSEHDWKVMANHKHNNKYDYSKSTYTNNKCNVIVICYIHGEFSQISRSHLIEGGGCRKCNLEDRNKNLPLIDSFKSHEKSKYWSSKNRLKPENISKSSHDEYYFDCPCGHEIKLSLNTIQDNRWCAYCGGKQLCDNDCDICFNKSFASHPRHIQWSKDNKCNPRDVYKSSNKKYLFNCDECKHVISMSLNNINIGCWCYYCANQQLCIDNHVNCQYCFKKTIADNPKSIYWSKKNTIEPHMCFKYDNRKYIFNCPDCKDEYNTSPNKISKGYWCGCTYNKTETRLHEYLKITYNTLVIEKQKKFDWCKNVLHLPFDFCFEEYKTIVELDGEQHFKDIKYFKSTSEETQKVDKYKMIQAKNNGYSIIRITQQDIWYDKNNWKQHLHDALEKTKNSIGNPIHIFIGDMYIKHYFTL